jgi:hypothetical protein
LTSYPVIPPPSRRVFFNRYKGDQRLSRLNNRSILSWITVTTNWVGIWAVICTMDRRNCHRNGRCLPWFSPGPNLVLLNRPCLVVCTINLPTCSTGRATYLARQN